MNTIKGILLIGVIFVLTIILAVKDVFHLNSGGINGENLGPALYGLFGFAIIFFVYLYLNKRK